MSHQREPSKSDSGWDEDIAQLDLTEWEKNGLQVYRNYTNAFQKRRAQDLQKQAENVAFDLDAFDKDLAVVAEADLVAAILAAGAIADHLIAEMFRREKRARLEMKTLLGPLGPLGDFNKRLKVAALAHFIDEDDLGFFDELRKLRNRIAHARRPGPPTREQIGRVTDAGPDWIDILASDSRAKIEVSDRHSEAVFRAGLLMHLAKLAWGTILTPLALRAGVPLRVLLSDPPPIFGRVSASGGRRAVLILRRASVTEEGA